MSQPTDDPTRVTLLHRLRQAPDDASAWTEFVGRYGAKILDWCRRWHLQEADAQDVAQTVLLRLAVKMRSFEYDPARSFRAWLRTLAHHAWTDLAGRRRPAAAGDNSAAWDALYSVPARDDLARRLDEVFDLELLEAASARVRGRVAGPTWDAFQLTARDGLPAADAAARLGLPVASVFKAKSNVLKMLREELDRLDGGAG
ncbi:MAG TPA: sigma-70 family RNA polymerase sigma factor [Gemmataceae bacterium]